jgi:hypothetical protein
MVLVQYKYNLFEQESQVLDKKNDFISIISLANNTASLQALPLDRQFPDG